MITSLRLEFLKSKRRGLMPMVLALIGVEIVWMYLAFRDPSANEISIGWMELLYQVPSLNSIIFPIAVAVLASRLADVEHKGDTWKLLGTVQPAKLLFTAKFLCGSWYIFVIDLMMTVSMLLCGALIGYDGTPDLQKYILFFVFQLVICLEILAFQLILSLLIRNQMIPLCIGCGGSFIGLLLMFVPVKAAQYLLPWGHASLLYLVYMVSWNKDTRILELAYTSVNWTAFAVAVLGIVCLVWAGRALLTKREV